MSENKEIQDLMKNNRTILLMGAPNVGKSVFFTHYTKVHVISSNYAGTTVSYMKGDFTLAGNNFTMIDVPGTYSLTSSNEAEELAILFLKNNPDGILFVLNAADLEGSIKLFLEVKRYNKPIICALNLSDVAKRQGKKIDVELLSKELNAPIISTVAVKQEGFEELDSKMEEVFSKVDSIEQKPIGDPIDTKALWKISKDITDKVVSYTSQEA